MEELFENKVLDDLYDSRSDGFEAIYMKKHKDKEQLMKSLKVEEELRKELKKAVINKEILSTILEKLDEFEGNVLEEMDFWNRQYYKLGFVDGNNIKVELKEEKEKMYNHNQENFLDNCCLDFIDYFEKQKCKNLLNRSDYQEITKKIEDIKNKYPKTRAFIEDSICDNLSPEEQKAILEIIGLNDELEILEIKEAFKLGIREKELI